MSGPIVVSASTSTLTGMLGAAVPAAAITAAVAIANRIAAEPLANEPLLRGVLAGAATESSPGQGTVLHGGVRVATPIAALANGIAAAGSAEAVVVPAFAASLAAAEYAGASPQDWLAAFALGAEVSIRLARGLERSGTRAFVPASAVGQIGATLAVCRVLGLDAAVAAPAMGLAAIQVSGTAKAGTPEHALSVGNAARVAVEVAFIVRFGASGPLNAVETAGLMIAAPGLADELSGLGHSWLLADSRSGDGELAPRLAALLQQEG